MAAAALAAQLTVATAARWFAGRLGDKYGPARLMVPGLLLVTAGMAAVAAIDAPAAVLGGSVVFGAGFGVLQTASLAMMYARAPRGGEDAVSAIWNMAFDLGMAAGAFGAGLVVSPLGFPVTFVLTAALILPALAIVRRDSTMAARSGPARLAGRVPQ
jgi:predicted MFS family arabinose efflux permease